VIEGAAGGVWSTMIVVALEAVPVLPAASVAVAVIECDPTARVDA